ncbi:MAG: NfeD family protein [Bacillaceae bacterium]|nr:NfeD family protein [Bacillaceae bacterium]
MDWLANPSIWILIAIAFVILEIFTLSFYLLWFGIGAFVSGIVAFFWQSPVDLILIFSAVSIILLIFTRPLAKKWFFKEDASLKNGADALIGRSGVVTKAIEPPHKGEIKIDGNHWSALADSTIAEGETVEITKVEGVTAYVRKTQNV